ncbi:DNA-binding CsgD family transcriptional regulator [Nonomuraea thailandensis]|uniref:DNA-binding CsgD family transcriptional regulator n=1 Tax=Nonomuraea thailandensis TaxID=1188745 RepID=A0A9X2GFX1_9ACTN|nr:LuxR family transcriptional regulator [Nonomuraea thailandensis]MCP2356922.1 DNA-binding CsgD family transcriptional regulator [Nonomuraea thailandensis]
MVIIGRDRERAEISGTVKSTAGRVLVVRGEAGVGKSALLEEAAELAVRDGHLVSRITGVEAESELPYSGLHQLLYQLLPLHDDSRTVLDAVTGRRADDPPSLMTLGIAVLELLSDIATRRPLLVILDDGQWLDDSSADVFGFVGRRIGSVPVKLLVAVRDEVVSRFDTAVLPEISVGPLADEDAVRLLDRHHPSLDRRVRQWVLNQALGNPLALLELPSQAGAAGLPRRLHQLYGSRIAALSDPARTELLMGALDGVGTRPGDGGPKPRHRMRNVDEAVACGLLDTEPITGDITFRHPLVRSSVVQMATPEQRRAAHRALADLHRDDLERRAMHLAAACVAPDEEAAQALEAAADSAIRHGGAVTAVGWLTRAAELSEDAVQQTRRRSYATFLSGYAARPGSELPPVRLTAGPDATVNAVHQAFFEDGDVRSAHRQAMAAIEALKGGPTETLTRLQVLLLAVDQYAADPAMWNETHRMLASLGTLVTEQTRIYSNTWSDVVLHGRGWAGPLERAAANLRDREPWDVTRLATAAYHLDIVGQYRPHLERVVDRELATGTMFSGLIMLTMIMLDQMGSGEWDAAVRTGERALALEIEHGRQLLAHQTRAHLAQLAALRGQITRALELRAEVDAWARPRGVGFVTDLADSIALTAALSSGDYEAAYRHAVGITTPGTFRPYCGQASRTLLDLVEAALHTGRTEQARRHALAARDAGFAALSPRLALTCYGALAMTADSEREAAGMFARATSHPAAARFPFETARIQLAQGIRLRHARERTAARSLLTHAAETFERLGAAAWAERAGIELRIIGSAPRVAAPDTSLTWQERRIADLAASGLTNKQIGERLRLSPRTVSSHLYRIFPKLGVTTRAALRDAMNRPGRVTTSAD